jgi:hypothetical protein
VVVVLVDLLHQDLLVVSGILRQLVQAKVILAETAQPHLHIQLVAEVVQAQLGEMRRVLLVEMAVVGQYH